MITCTYNHNVNVLRDLRCYIKVLNIETHTLIFGTYILNFTILYFGILNFVLQKTLKYHILKSKLHNGNLFWPMVNYWVF
jgi:hypothetical protein